MKLLNIDANAKTVKGQGRGYMTAILYLAPADESGYEVCPMASKGCRKACLNKAGMGAFSNVQAARIAKTRWYFEDRAAFMTQLVTEIGAFIRKAIKLGLIPVVRLNGTSDMAATNGANIAVVFRNDKFPSTFMGMPVVDGDADDLRFLDGRGVVVGLKAKGPAKKDFTGFVREVA